jgi:hypothetical protein
MKYLRTKEQLNEMLSSGKIIIIIFVDPNEFMPAKLLLNYIYSHGATPKIDHLIFIWNLVDQEIYDLYNVVAFPQITVLKGRQVVYSALGYNREKANEAIEALCQEAGLGKPIKQLNKGLAHCPNGHELSLLDNNREEIYVGGCFECNKCNRLCHF